MPAAATKHTLTTPTEREIRVERVFDAPRAKVFAAYTDPERIPRWWGPHGTTTTVDRMDVRVGGEWRFVCESAQGTTAFRGAYREIVPDERIQQTFEWEGMPGYVSLETASFEDTDDGRTRVVTTSLFFTPEERDGMLNSGMEGGMGETFERLDAVLAEA